MRILLHGLLTALAYILATVAPITPHPYDRLITGVAQLLLFMAVLL